nr:immunoglobulin heavy chain junction region [Macaca mulatta]
CVRVRGVIILYFDYW